MDFYRINDQGKIWIQRVADVSLIGFRDHDEGRLLYSESDEKLYIATSTEWRELSAEYSVLTANTKMIFGSYPLPVGWNISTNSGMVIALTTSSGSIGTTDGTWTISGMNNIDSHNHAGVTGTESSYREAKLHSTGNRYTCAARYHTHTIVADGVHSHTFTSSWRPAHVFFTEAILQ